MKYQENLQKYLDNAKNLSLINHHEFVTCEHVLFALLKLSTDFKDIFEEFSDGDLELLEYRFFRKAHTGFKKLF